MKRANPGACRVWLAGLGLALALLTQAGIAPADEGTVVKDEQMNLQFTIPNGFSMYAKGDGPYKQENMYVRYYRSRDFIDDRFCLSILFEKFPVLIHSSREGDKLLQSMGRTRKVYELKWKTHSLNVFVFDFVVGGVEKSYHCLVLPGEKGAIRLAVAGPKPRDSEVGKTLRELLATVEGPSNWDKQHQVEGGEESRTIQYPERDLEFTIPAGFAQMTHLPSAHEHQFLCGFEQTDASSPHQRILLFVMPIRDKPRPEDLSADGMRRDGALRVYQRWWNGHMLNIAVVDVNSQGIRKLQHNVLIPAASGTLTLGVRGPASKDARMQEVLESVLASMKTPSYWDEGSGVDSGVEARPGSEFDVMSAIWQGLFISAGYAVMVFFIVMSSERSFRRCAENSGIDPAKVAKRIKPDWMLYMLVPVLFLGLGMPGMAVTTRSFFSSSSGEGRWPDFLGPVLMAIAPIAAGVVLWLVARGRAGYKRRLLEQALTPSVAGGAEASRSAEVPGIRQVAPPPPPEGLTAGDQAAPDSREDDSSTGGFDT